ncbi:RHS repeat-associated core domain-containing protein [Pseudomonas zanjanensis]|uniref:RHS repeat-associated core domain-containing protein n=1 Tax=Pseudomonas zanjanensis TaxID=2745496 RepID=UPI001CECBA29|nr:RHS repeat-associated core domain-containing protein [Pseudomonas zanjanensis]
MSTSSMKILCRYQYDPLDRLTGLKPAEHLDTQRFYQDDELVNEIEGQVELTILRHEAQPLAQRLHIANVTETTLLATDQQRSVLQTLAGTDTQPMAYTAYGHRPAESGLSSLLGFNGERPDPVTGHYLLGQGNRAFNPVLMRFNSPDELSPFGDGGINAYAYCGGDPVNRYDPSGNIPFHIVLKLQATRGFTAPTALNRSSRAIARPASQASHTKTIIQPQTITQLLQNPREVTASSAQNQPTPLYKNGQPKPPEELSTHPSTVYTRRYKTKIKKISDAWIEHDAKNPGGPELADPALIKLFNRYKEIRHTEASKATTLGLKLEARARYLKPIDAKISRLRLKINKNRWENLNKKQSQFRKQT